MERATWTEMTADRGLQIVARRHGADPCAGGEKQRGIITYGVSANRQNPFAGAAHDAIFNTFRRFRGQVLYIVPPMIAGYYAMDWAIHR